MININHIIILKFTLSFKNILNVNGFKIKIEYTYM